MRKRINRLCIFLLGGTIWGHIRRSAGKTVVGAVLLGSLLGDSERDVSKKCQSFTDSFFLALYNKKRSRHAQ